MINHLQPLSTNGIKSININKPSTLPKKQGNRPNCSGSIIAPPRREVHRFTAKQLPEWLYKGRFKEIVSSPGTGHTRAADHPAMNHGK